MSTAAISRRFKAVQRYYTAALPGGVAAVAYADVKFHVSYLGECMCACILLSDVHKHVRT